MNIGLFKTKMIESVKKSFWKDKYGMKLSGEYVANYIKNNWDNYQCCPDYEENNFKHIYFKNGEEFHRMD